MSGLRPATPDFEARLRDALPLETFRPLTEHYLTELRGQMRGADGLVLAPASTQEVSRILAAANAERVGVVPFAGGTGLVGGQVAPGVPRPVILSLERMERTREVHPSENVVVVEAGKILQALREEADAMGRLFPLLLASEGSARIGGNLATNAGGMNVLRYGNARDLVLGLEAVLPNGTVVSDLKRLRKDNTGLDIKNLFIGSEGILGVITAASLRLFDKPAHVGTALLVVRDPAAALELLEIARDVAGDLVSIFELISGEGFRFIAETFPDHRLPFDAAPAWMVLGEIGAPRGVDVEALWSAVLQDGMARGLVLDGTIAQSALQRDAFVATRELIPEANRRIGAISSHDISLPLSTIPEFIPECEAALSRFGPVRVNCFGHLGDGNLHYNVYPPKGMAKRDMGVTRQEVADLVHSMVVDRGGSFSAEHGVGRLKRGELQRFGDPGRLEAMRAIKAALDPHGIMNPGVILA